MSALVPAQADILQQARLYLDAGRYEEAEATIARALSAGQGSCAAFRLRADIARARGNCSGEAHALECLLALLTPDDREEAARTWSRLAILRSRLGDTSGAIGAWQSATRSDPGEFEYYRGLARARFIAQDLEGVCRSAEQLLQQFPREAFSHVFTGHVHKAFGRRSEAAECYRRALELDSSSGEALYNLVESAGTDLDVETRRRAVDLSSCESAPAADRINAAFAAARIFDRELHHREAFKYLRLANDLARGDLARYGVRYDPAATVAKVSRTIAAYPRRSFEKALSDLSIDTVPIFVVGLPRSGTTLIEQILSSHSAVQTGGELLAAQQSEFEFRRARSAVGREGVINPSDPVDARLLEDARERYIDALFERGLSGAHVVDKLPANFEIAGFLRLMFPNAPIVHAVRDLRAVGFSLYNANFGAHEPWKHDLDDLAHYLLQYRRLMSHWGVAMQTPFIDVVYEEMVSDPERRIADLLRAVGLTWERACVSFYQRVRPVLTASHAQVQRPIYTESIDYWRNYATWLGAVSRLPYR